jgi:metallo-beta-lactamase family protein
MYQCFEHMEYVEVGEEIILNDNLKVIFHPNSHVVGANSISIIIRKPNNSVKHILYSSDMGSNINREFQPFLDEMKLPNKCNLFISEATYCDKSREFTKKDCINEREQLKKLIKDAIHENKRILFATFSFSRSQLLLSMMYDWWKDEEWFQEVPVMVDGLLMNKINDTYLNILEGEEKEYFQKILSMKNVKLNREYGGTKMALSKRVAGIYLAGSGFCTAGRIISYLPQFLGSSKDIVILTGYCGGEGSIGWKLLDDELRTITIEKQVILKNAKIKQLKTFSSHISYQELLDLWSGMRCDKILIHHANDKNKHIMVKEAKDYLLSKNNTTPVIAVGKCANQFVL